ncbi:EAL domain-containing protein [Vibrio parahaemolyticus]|nr:EAL domain-containing protein [Vibrio parahaemolyticus]MDF4635762.1 EAL domain-containing protein [Vibrio parahaemolyticus]HBH7877579.1 EAL domain-containing protein [Vibrio parahaemolyticus]
MKKIPLIALFIFVFFVVSIFATIISLQLQKIEQKDFASQLLINAEETTEQLIVVLSKTHEFYDFKCEKKHIDKLRKLVQLNSEIYDVGYFVGSTVYCSANLGVVSPTKLIPRDVGIGINYVFYTNENNLYEIEKDYNITASGNFFAINITTPYSRQIKVMPKFIFKIYSPSMDYVFDYYSPYDEKEISYGFFLEYELCSNKYELCVKTEIKNSGLSYYGPKKLVIIILFIFVFSCLTTNLILSLINQSKSLENRFKNALRNENLHMEYQPIIDIRSNRVVSVECLVRWSDKVYGKVAPPLFIDMAEKLSLYPKLAYFTTTRSITEMASILISDRDFSLSINIGNYEILDGSYLVFLKNIANKMNVNPNQIRIEITEEINVGLRELAEFSSRARSLGFIIVLDDFGTGVSNLVWLTEINFDFIKIDRVFVKALNYDVKKSMSSAIMDLVASLDKEVVFEGVETEKEFNIIKEQYSKGFVQGWYFYKAMSINGVISLLEDQRLR